MECEMDIAYTSILSFHPSPLDTDTSLIYFSSPVEITPECREYSIDESPHIGGRVCYILRAIDDSHFETVWYYIIESIKRHLVISRIVLHDRDIGVCFGHL